MIIPGFIRFSSYRMLVLDKSIVERYAVEKAYLIGNSHIGSGKGFGPGSALRGFSIPKLLSPTPALKAQ
jgi:hypothetical protein